MGYNNEGLPSRRPGKPHIQKQEGWWRVSPRPRHDALGRWKEAHHLVHRKNHANVCPHCGSQLPPE